PRQKITVISSSDTRLKPCANAHFLALAEARSNQQKLAPLLLTSRRSQVRVLHCPPIIFIHLVNLRIWKVARTRGIYRGPHINFATRWPADGLNRAAQILNADIRTIVAGDHQTILAILAMGTPASSIRDTAV